MSRARVAWLLLAFVALAGAIGLYLRSRPAPDAAVEDSGPSRAEILAERRAAHERRALEQAPCTAQGRVVRAADRLGIGGATVFLRPSSMRADRQDHFAITADDSGAWSAKDLPPGIYDVSATTEGAMPASLRKVVLEPGRDHVGLDLELGDGGTVVDGFVGDAQGEPIAAAEVLAVEFVIGWQTGVPRFFATHADEEGKFRFALRPGKYSVLASREDFAAQGRVVTLADEPRTLTFALVPGSTIEGVVRAYEDGRPIVGARVEAGGASSITSMVGFGGTAGATTDEDGRFSLDGVHAGIIELSARGESVGTLSPISVPVGIGETVTDVEILVSRTQTLAGFVVESGNETRGIPGIMITVNQPGVDMFASARVSEPTDADGYFEIRGLKAGRYMVMPFGQGWLPKMEMTRVGEEDVDDLLLSLDGGVTIRGRVVPTPTQRTTIRASVIRDAQDEASIGAVLSAMTTVWSTLSTSEVEPDGTFEFGPVLPGNFLLEAGSQGGPTGSVRVEVGSEGASDVELPVTEEPKLTGTVIDEDDNAVPGVGVALHRIADPDEPTLLSSASEPRLRDVTDARGAFEVRGVPPGRYTVVARDDFEIPIPRSSALPARQRFLPVLVELVDGRAADPVEVRVRAPADTLSGQVLDPEGAPVAQAWVSALPGFDIGEYTEALSMATNVPEEGEEGEEGDDSDDSEYGAAGVVPGLVEQFRRALASPPVVTDAEGRFEIPNLPRQTYTVVAQAERASQRVQLDGVVTSDAPVLRLQALGRLTVEPTGLAPSGVVEIRVEGPDRRTRSIRAEDLPVTFERLLPGRYAVRLAAPDATGRATAEVEAAELTRQPVPLVARATVRGRLVDGAGEPVAGAAVFQTSGADEQASTMSAALDLIAGAGGDERLATADDGTFSIEGVAAGWVEIRFLRGFSDDAGSVRLWVDGKDVDLGDVLGHPSPDAAGTLGLSTDERIGLRTKDDDAPFDPGAPPWRLWVREVDPGSAGAKAGIETGDEIVAIDGRPLGNGTDGTLSAGVGDEIVESPAVGQRLSLEISRDGERRTVALLAQAEPSEAPGGP